MISTNAIEGLFSRMKRMLKGHHAIPGQSEGYGEHLGEFLWRSRFVQRKRGEWRRRAFFELLRAIRSTSPAPNMDPLEPMEFDPWFDETYQWLKSKYSAPRVRCNRGVRRSRVDPRPRRHPQEREGQAADRAPGVIPLFDLEADLEEVIDEASRKRPPSPMPLADAGSGDGVVAGTGRTRRVRRRRDHPSAYIRVYPQPPEAAPSREEEPENESVFTPTLVNDGTRCVARTWNGGIGGQCNRPPDAGPTVGVCRRHASEQQ